MAVNILGLRSDFSAGEVLPAAEVNLVAAELLLLHTQLCELLGAGVFLPADFNGTIVASQLAVDVSAGTAIVGPSDGRILVQSTATVRVSGLTASTTNYVWLKRDGTFVSNTSGAEPEAGAQLLMTCVTDSDDVTSINNFPAGRRNLAGARANQTPVSAKTADHTVLDSESGTTFTTVGAGGTVTFSLPPAVLGLRYRFRVGAAQQLRIDPNGTETIALPSTGVQGAAGKYLVADADGETVDLACDKAGQWSVYGFTGTWTAEA
jgi:hypothetical protein